MYDGFAALARIDVTDAGGKAWSLRAIDIGPVKEVTDGSLITFSNGSQLQVTTKPTAITTAIDTLWTEYTTALGDPA